MMEKKLTCHTETGTKPLKILHVLGKMRVGGIETWLMQVLRRLDRNKMQIDLLVRGPDFYDQEAQALGAKILVCPYPAPPWTFAAKFLSLVRENGPYQIIHSHYPRSGFILFLARLAGIPVRIFQSHNDETIRKTQVSRQYRFSMALSKYLILHYATSGFAVSHLAALALFGPHWQADPRWQIFPAISDLSPFMVPVNRQEVRESLGLPESAFVMGHVGRFDLQKNHDFLIEVAAEVCRRLPEAYLLLIGDGILRPAMEKKVADLGLSRRIIFTGVRTDVPRLMRGAMDIFLFPSFFEGLGMALVEAQVSGLPCLIADTIPQEVEVIPELVRRVSLNAGARAWAEAVLTAGKPQKTFGYQDVDARLQHTLFDIKTNVDHLLGIYASAAGICP